MSTPTPEAVRELIAKWRQEAAIRDDGTHGRSACSTGAQHLRWCADELETVMRDAAGLLRPTPAVTDDEREILHTLIADLYAIIDVDAHETLADRASAVLEPCDGGTCVPPVAAGSPLAGERILQKAHEEKNPETRVDSVPGSEHGDLPRPPTGDK